MNDQREPIAPSYGKSAALLSGALGVAGVLTYGFFALASHSLNPHDYGLVVVLWSVMFVAISVLFRPVEQLLSRTVAELEASGTSARSGLRVAAQIQVGVALMFVVGAFILRGPIEAELFGGDVLFFWALIVSILGFAVSFYVRGMLAGKGQFAAYAWLLLVDAVAKTACALAVAIGISSGPGLLAIGIAVAPFLSVAVVPIALSVYDEDREKASQAVGGQDPAPPFTLAQGGSFAAAILVVMLSEQVFLNSGVLFVRAEDGTAAAGLAFNILMVVRAPAVMFQAVATSLLPHLTRVRTLREGKESGFDRAVSTTLLAVAAFTLLVALAMLIAGPSLMQLAFGDGFEYERAQLVLMSLGMGLFLASSTLNQAVLAQGRARTAAVAWGAAAAALLIWSAIPVVEDVLVRAETGFVGAASVLLVLMAVAYSRPGQETDEIVPGSPKELEATIAAAEAT